MSLLDRFMEWATRHAPKTLTTPARPLRLDAYVARERQRLEERREQNTEELRQLSLVEAEVAALKADGEVVQGRYRAPRKKRGDDADQGHQMA